MIYYRKLILISQCLKYYPARPLEQLTEAMKEVYIVRHGETFDNRNRIIQGQADSALTEEGKSSIRKHLGDNHCRPVLNCFHKKNRKNYRFCFQQVVRE